MTDKLKAVLDRIEEQSRVWLEPDENSLDLCRKVYRNNTLPLHTRMRAAIAALPHEVPKLGVSINVNDDGSFAAQLDAAIRRSNGTKVIEHQKDAGSLAEGSLSEAEQDSREHSRRPILPRLTRRI